MQNHTGLLNEKPLLSTGIVKSIHDAVSADIQMDIINNGFDTNNGTPTRIWDFINRNIGLNLPSTDFISKPTKRGIWELKPIYDKADGILYTIMREERFGQLVRENQKRASSHYVRALAFQLNQDIYHDENQISFLENEVSFDEMKLKDIVSRISLDLGVAENTVNNHVLILFSSKGNMLVSVRACVVKGNLSVIDEVNWNKYIVVDDIQIHDTINVDETITPEDNLKFKVKATSKLMEKENIRRKNNLDIEKQKKIR